MDRGDDFLDRLVDAVLSSPKYRNISPDLVRSVGARELAKGRDHREAVKATKTKLHQAVGAYSGGSTRYDRWLDELRRAYDSGKHEDVLRVNTEVMRSHSSTRERLPILEKFYATTLGNLAPIRSVVDIACGLNPLALPWMPLAGGAEYHAYDVDQSMTGFLSGFLAIANVRGGAQTLDVTRELPDRGADVALLLKAVPCLEQLDPSAGLRLLDGLDSRHLLVSFPVRSLGGRSKGMARTYEARFAELIADRNWSVRRFEFATELAFLVTK